MCIDTPVSEVCSTRVSAAELLSHRKQIIKAAPNPTKAVIGTSRPGTGDPLSFELDAAGPDDCELEDAIPADRAVEEAVLMECAGLKEDCEVELRLDFGVLEDGWPSALRKRDQL